MLSEDKQKYSLHGQTLREVSENQLLKEEELNKKALDLFSQIDIDFEILHQKYLVCKINLKLYYLEISNCSDAAAPLVLKKINLELRPGHISQMMQTQIPHLFQFVHNQSEPDSGVYIITWNLETNMEDQMLEVPPKCFDAEEGI